jgi:hypothetical protein
MSKVKHVVKQHKGKSGVAGGIKEGPFETFTTDNRALTNRERGMPTTHTVKQHGSSSRRRRQ